MVYFCCQHVLKFSPTRPGRLKRIVLSEHCELPDLNQDSETEGTQHLATVSRYI